MTNFSKDDLVVGLGWPAGLNTSFIYIGLVLLQNLNDIELIIYSKQSFTGSQSFFSNSICPIWALLFKFKHNCMYLFWSICNFKFSILLKLGYQAEQVYSKWGCIRELKSNLQDRVETRTCFLYRNLSLLLTFFETFKARKSSVQWATKICHCIICHCLTVWY